MAHLESNRRASPPGIAPPGLTPGAAQDLQLLNAAGAEVDVLLAANPRPSPTTGLPASPTTGLPTSPTTGLPGYLTTRLPASPTTRLPDYATTGLLFFFLLSAWELSARLGWINDLYFPPPSFILSTAGELLLSGELWEHLSATLWRVGCALLLGGAPGLLLGLLMGWRRGLGKLFEPFVAALHPLPKIAILPLVMVIFGVNDASLVIVSAMAVFFPMLINTMTGVWQIHPIHFEVAANYGASPWQVFSRVVWPGCRAWLLAGLRLALNTALLLVVAAEMVVANAGLGRMIVMAWNTMRPEEIYVTLLVTILLGLISAQLVHLVARVWMPWESERTA